MTKTPCLNKMKAYARQCLSVVLLLWTACLSMQAQERKVQHKPYIDDRRFHYGFTIGFHDQSLSLENNGFIDPATSSQWVAACDRHNYGFTVGVLGEWRLNRYFSLRAIPSLHFGSKHIVFRDLATENRESQDMKSTFVAVPIDLKISAPRFNNYRPYIVLGASPMYDLTARKHTLLRTKATQVMLEAGMGCDFYLPFFKLIPELKFCFSPGNVLKKNRPDLTDPTQLVFTQSVDKGTATMVVLSFYFE